MEFDWMQLLKAGLGTLAAILVVGGLFVMFVRDVTQKKHTVLRNFPVIGHTRKWLQHLGVFFRRPAINGINDLVALFHKVLLERLQILLAVPWATTGRAQALHDLQQTFYRRSGICCTATRFFEVRHCVSLAPCIWVFHGRGCRRLCAWRKN